MHVRAPFAYSVDYFKHDGRKLVQRSLVDHVEGYVPEIHEGEAPVALRWSMRPRIGDHYHPCEVRYHAGRFYSKAGRDFMDGFPSDLPAEILVHPETTAGAAALFSGEGFGRFHNAVMEHLKGKNQKRPAARDVETDLGDDHDEQRAKAERRLAGLAVIGGKVWAEVHEPTLYVRSDTGMLYDSQIQRGVLLREPRLDTFGVPPEAAAYRIDQAHLWHPVRAPAGKETLRDRARDIVVEMPEVFVFDFVENTTLRTVEAFVALMGPEIHGLARETIDAYLAVREKLRDYLNGTAHDMSGMLNEVVDVMANIRGRTEAYRTVSRACTYALKQEPTISLDI